MNDATYNLFNNTLGILCLIHELLYHNHTHKARNSVGLTLYSLVNQWSIQHPNLLVTNDGSVDSFQIQKLSKCLLVLIVLLNRSVETLESIG